MTEGLGANVPRCYLLALGWKTGEDTPALAAVRNQQSGRLGCDSGISEEGSLLFCC